jgi:hypothetical protein
MVNQWVFAFSHGGENGDLVCASDGGSPCANIVSQGQAIDQGDFSKQTTTAVLATLERQSLEEAVDAQFAGKAPAAARYCGPPR